MKLILAVVQDLEELLERAAQSEPIVIVIDDVQWADAGTAAALRALALRTDLLSLNPNDPDARRAVGASKDRLAEVELERGDTAAAWSGAASENSSS